VDAKQQRHLGFSWAWLWQHWAGLPANIGDATWNDAKYNTVPWNTPGGGADFCLDRERRHPRREECKCGLHVGLDHPNGGRRSSLARRHDERRMAAQKRCRNRADHLSRVLYERGSDRAGVLQYGPDLSVSYLVPVSELSSLWLTALGGFAVVLIVRGQLLRRLQTTADATVRQAPRPCPKPFTVASLLRRRYRSGLTPIADQSANIMGLQLSVGCSQRRCL
jgi:hypothetical protein